MKKVYVPVNLIAALILIGFASFSFTACESGVNNSGPKPNEPSADISLEDKGNSVVNDQEEDGTVIERVKSPDSAFYGTWIATSGKALNLYGNIEVTVNEDGTWEGNITDEELRGEWVTQGDHLHLNNDLFSFDLVFDKSGALIFIDSEAEEDINIVLKRK